MFQVSRINIVPAPGSEADQGPGKPGFLQRVRDRLKAAYNSVDTSMKTMWRKPKVQQDL